MRENTRNTDSQ
uniref:Uncharacterized protein n=1 Tax=Anguilla anguilla TaxID=7936 RepID=A0A0E9SGF3_ANGAN